MNKLEIKVPDLGGASDVEVIDILVKTGDSVEVESSLITVESDKASMDIPSPVAGIVSQLHVSLGDVVNEEQLIVSLDLVENDQVEPAENATGSIDETTLSENVAAKAEEVVTPTPDTLSKADKHTQLLVIGSGPGGYTAAFRAADLGMQVTLVEKYSELGGVCLNVGCIPSKALLHSAAVISQVRDIAQHGIEFGEPSIDLGKLRHFKESVISKLTGGLASMAKSRKVEVVQGLAQFTSTNSISITQADSISSLSFDQAIIAAGSRVTVLPAFESDDPRIIDSTGALALDDIPASLLIVGGGIIGLEMATVYSELGSDVSIVEFLPQIMAGADKDLVAPLLKRLKGQVSEVMLKTKVEELESQDDGILVHFAKADNDEQLESKKYDRVLIATGRRPNGDQINAQAAGVTVDERGFIPVDSQMRTNQGHIFAIGDIVGQPMLAHKATHEAKAAAEVCAGMKSAFEANVIPSVAYTDPEVAWVGLTETEAKANGIAYEKGVFPWAASGRAIGNDRTEGKTKLLFDPETHRVIGGGIVGPQAGDLIAEIALAIEMGADATDIGLTIHPHPTLSETVAMAAEVYEGTITDLYIPKKK